MRNFLANPSIRSRLLGMLSLRVSNGSLQEQSQHLAEAVAVFKLKAGEVIDVPAAQLAGRARAGRLGAGALRLA